MPFPSLTYPADHDHDHNSCILSLSSLFALVLLLQNLRFLLRQFLVDLGAFARFVAVGFRLCHPNISRTY